MSKVDMDNLGALSMLELFQLEVESQTSILTRGLLGSSGRSIPRDIWRN